MGSKPVGYSASRVSAIIGLNHFKTPVEAFLEIKEEMEPGFCAAKGYQLPKRVDSAPIRWGHAFESSIIKIREDQTGYHAKDREKFFKKRVYENDFGWIDLSCHIDFRFTDDIVEEGKTTNEYAFTQIKDDKMRWGADETDEVPEEYQVQCAVQRICTKSDLVKLSVLVFPKPVDEYEKIGWMIETIMQNKYSLINPMMKTSHFPMTGADPLTWASVIAQQGNFHTYNLERNESLESEIIRTVQDFHKHHTIPGIPPEPREYDDIRRLLSNPIGTIIPDPDDPILEKCRRYSEVTRQLGKSGPLASEKELLKLEIASRFLGSRDEWTQPHDKAIIVDPNGGDILASFSKSGFRTKRAK